MTETLFSLHRARQPRFPIGIQDRTFELVINTLDQLNYHGPLALSCDDTKLLASLRPFYNKEKEAWFVLGHVGEPYQLLDYEDFKTVTNSGDLQKATKVRDIYSIMLCCHVVRPTWTYTGTYMHFSSGYFVCRFQYQKHRP